MVELGKIEKVNVRDIWPNEAADFTPWLGEHMSEFGEALGLELEVQAQEAPVGGYSLDILAHDLGRNRPVIIENQLEGTDHDHLGKLLTYASGYDSNVVVWIAREFRDEHRQALDWLNQRTNEETEFFGVVVELLRIDDSRPAVNFKLVSTPNEWSMGSIKAGTTGNSNTSEKGERYRAFFQGLIDSLREEHSFTRARKGQPQNWYSFSAGHQGISYGANFPREGARVEIYIDRGDADLNEWLLDRLVEDKESIECTLQCSLEWERLDNRRACRISTVRTGSIENDPETLEHIQDWMLERLLKFKQVFGPRLDELG